MAPEPEPVTFVCGCLRFEGSGLAIIIYGYGNNQFIIYGNNHCDHDVDNNGRSDNDHTHLQEPSEVTASKVLPQASSCNRGNSRFIG